MSTAAETMATRASKRRRPAKRREPLQRYQSPTKTWRRACAFRRPKFAQLSVSAAPFSSAPNNERCVVSHQTGSPTTFVALVWTPRVDHSPRPSSQKAHRMPAEKFTGRVKLMGSRRAETRSSRSVASDRMVSTADPTTFVEPLRASTSGLDASKEATTNVGSSKA